jgi:hypothetical protein
MREELPCVSPVQSKVLQGLVTVIFLLAPVLVVIPPWRPPPAFVAVGSALLLPLHHYLLRGVAASSVIWQYVCAVLVIPVLAVALSSVAATALTAVLSPILSPLLPAESVRHFVWSTFYILGVFVGLLVWWAGQPKGAAGRAGRLTSGCS